jgi:hypothetical protein
LKFCLNFYEYFLRNYKVIQKSVWRY